MRFVDQSCNLKRIILVLLDKYAIFHFVLINFLKKLRSWPQIKYNPIVLNIIIQHKETFGVQCIW